MALKHVFFILALTCLIMANIANATSRNDRLNNNLKPDYDLATRLEASGGLTECWNALMELKSWSNEIVIFFLNSQADIGLIVAALLISLPVIAGLQCSPLSDSLPKKWNLLRGYCDASPAPSPCGLAVIYQPQVSKVLA
ncbi:hypothetical protein WN944_020765 [Citrus x changshan-huyou]|uniref:Prolamin-like domain-containing protein n=1 Tax=Citrus x changshan-huyou TaxID=2935761 RepID=A0AAP0LYH0_9ROSI